MIIRKITPDVVKIDPWYVTKEVTMIAHKDKYAGLSTDIGSIIIGVPGNQYAWLIDPSGNKTPSRYQLEDLYLDEFIERTTGKLLVDGLLPEPTPKTSIDYNTDVAQPIYFQLTEPERQVYNRLKSLIPDSFL